MRIVHQRDFAAAAITAAGAPCAEVIRATVFGAGMADVAGGISADAAREAKRKRRGRRFGKRRWRWKRMGHGFLFLLVALGAGADAAGAEAGRRAVGCINAAERQLCASSLAMRSSSCLVETNSIR